jgi:N6-adenosine-specific RNA methylase IME4
MTGQVHVPGCAAWVERESLDIGGHIIYTPDACTCWEGLSPPYGTIVADPPWKYDDGFVIGQRSGRRTDAHEGRVPTHRPLPYSGMDLDEIRALPVVDLALPDCWLFLWTTNRYLPESFSVVDAWGFRYAQTLVWHKTGSPSPFGGSIAPNHAEYVIIGKRGSPPVVNRVSSSVIAANRLTAGKTHSKKPGAVLDAIETATAGPYVELFARAPRLGWDHWGHGYELGGRATV